MGVTFRDLTKRAKMSISGILQRGVTKTPFLFQESYKDPITEFVESLYVNFDFDEAQSKLKECTTVIENDFFIVGCLDDFTENARLIISEIFCRIHQVNLLCNRYYANVV